MKILKKVLRRSVAPALGNTAMEQARDVQQPQSTAPAGPLRVILFIGHHKVGSTSLQGYLSRNAVPLAEAGILYPYVDFEGMAHVAARACGSPVDALPINVREPHNALAFKMLAVQQDGEVPGYHKRLPPLPQMFHAIRSQIQFSRPHTVILAAEVFANFNAVSPRLIDQLAEQFPGAEFTVIATLRRIDEYLASWQGQRLKFGHQLEPLCGEGLAGYFGGIHFNYRLMIEGWLQRLPKAKIILRDYAQVRAGGGSVVDFIAQTGLQLPEGLVPEQRENDSLHRGVYEIARQANQQLPGPKARQLRSLLRERAAQLQLPPSHEIELFGAEKRALMLERFRPIDSYLGEVMGRSAFFADLEQVQTCLPCSELESHRQALAQICAGVDWIQDEELLQFLAQMQAQNQELSQG